MHLSIKKVSVALLSASALTALSFAAPVAAQQTQLLPMAEGDFGAAELVAPLGLKAAAVPTEAVSMSWALGADKAIDAAPQGFVATSKEYWVDVTAKDLSQGVSLFTQAPGALIRLNPAPGEKGLAGLPLDPSALTVIDPAKRAFTDGSAMELMATAQQLKAAGSPFVEGTAAFRLRSELGAGTFTLKAAGLSGGHYVMHVLDRQSPVELAVKSLASDYLHGQQLHLEASLQADGLKVAMGDVDGFVVSPAGRTWPVRFAATGQGSHKASLALDALEAPAPGLWEAHVAAQGLADGLAVRRYTKVAFNVAVPSARLSGGAEKVAMLNGGLAVRFGVTTVAASRYEVRGVLYGTAADGGMQPIAVAHSADWLEAGDHGIVMSFDRPLVEGSGLSAPFEIRDLRLIDQGTMGTLHRQARGVLLQ